MKQAIHKKQQQTMLLTVSGLNVDTPAGRPLIRDLNLSMAYEQVALVGRNGVGKSTLLTLLAEKKSAHKEIVSITEPCLVPQRLNKRPAVNNLQWLKSIFSGIAFFDWQLCDEFATIGLRPYQELANSDGFSCGELRKLYLLAAKFKHPELLLLDEPTGDLDKTGLHWLQKYLGNYSKGLIIISHERSVLQCFNHFLIMAESGCRYFRGSFTELEKNLESEDNERQKHYLRTLNRLINQEEHNEKILQRRQQKKSQGRLRELGRMTPRVRLNKKRGTAQVSQGKAAKVQQECINSVRDLVKATRRYLSVSLPMEQLLPDLPDNDGIDIIALDNVSATADSRELFSKISLNMQRNRLGIMGPNGTGKSTLLRIMLSQQPPATGASISKLKKLGFISQGASNWIVEESLISQLLTSTSEASPEILARLLVGHKFPLALAVRPLNSLSQGERLRAALICLFARRPAIEFLVLDEPALSLDFVGDSGLRAGLNAWRGGLIIVSHDKDFLQEIGIQHYLTLDGQGGHSFTAEGLHKLNL